jgi:hypothetical protein
VVAPPVFRGGDFDDGQTGFSPNFLSKKRRKMLNLQHQYNNHTTIPHMRVDPTHWSPHSCEGLMCGCCDGVVYESNPKREKPTILLSVICRWRIGWSKIQKKILVLQFAKRLQYAISLNLMVLEV